MKIYTIDKYEMRPSVTVEHHPLPDGGRFACFTLGEEGRGRRRVIVPVILKPETYRHWFDKGFVEVTDVRPVFSMRGFSRLEELSQEEKTDEYLIVLLGWIGFRGHNALTDLDGNRLGSDVILAEGTIAQGQAGRVGWGSQWLLRVKVGDLLRYEVTGRLYGEPGKFVIHCTASGPHLYTEEVWNAIQDLEA